MPLKTYRAWKLKQADIGCVFARFMAAQPKKHGQWAGIISGRNAATVAEAISQQVALLVEDPKIQAAALVLPDVNSLKTLTKIALALSQEEHWAVGRKVIRNTPAGDVVAFNVTRRIPIEGGTTCPSESLIFGPFSIFPKTRRAPIAALEIFVGVAPKWQRDGTRTTSGHLADARLTLPSQKTYDHMDEETTKARSASLGGVKDERAKAKVSFVIPMELASSLGCVP